MELKKASITKVFPNLKSKFAELYLNDNFVFLGNVLGQLDLNVWVGDKKIPDFAFIDALNKKIHIIIGDRKLITNEKTLMFILFHEILHYVQNHSRRGVNKDYGGWLLACDAWINYHLDIISCGLIEKPPSGIYWDVGSMTEEEIYESLMENSNKNSKSSCSGNSSSSSNSRGSCGNSTSGSTSKRYNTKIGNVGDLGDLEIESKQYSVDKKVVNLKVVKLGDETSIDVSHNIDKGKARESMRKILRNAWSVSKGKLKGDDPLGLKRRLEDLFDEKVNWNVILKRLVVTKLEKDRDSRTWAKVNPYYIELGLFPYDDCKEVPETVVIILDSSGSMSEEDMSLLNIFIKGLKQHTDRIIVLVHDAELQQVIYNPKKIIRYVPGGGGTSHRSVIDWLLKNERKEKISSVIIISDFYSDLEMYWDRIKNKHYSKILVLTKNGRIPDVDNAFMVEIS